MIPKKPAPDLIRGGNRFSDKITPKIKILAGQADSIRIDQTLAVEIEMIYYIILRPEQTKGRAVWINLSLIRAMARYRILRAGSSTPSGNAALDQAAIEAVLRTSFPAPPQGMTEHELTCVVPFYFKKTGRLPLIEAWHPSAGVVSWAR